MNCNTIKKKIRFSSFIQIILPIIPILLCAFLFSKVPFETIFFPKSIIANDSRPLGESLLSVTDGSLKYYSITFPELHYTGYDLMDGSDSEGSYYYYMVDTSCVFVLVDSRNISGNPSVLTNYSVKGRTMTRNSNFEMMLDSFARDINWSYEGVSKTSMSYYISEPDYHLRFYLVVCITTCLILVVSIAIMITNILYILFPYALHPAYKLLRKSFMGPNGKLGIELLLVDEELSSENYYIVGKILITESYLIDTSLRKPAIIPLDDIIWVYSHQTLRKFLWYNINIYSSMTFITNKGHSFSMRRLPADEARQLYSIFESRPSGILLKYSKENKFIANRIIKANKTNIKK